MMHVFGVDAPTNNNCWKGTIDLQNGNRGLFVAGVKAKKTELTEQINNAADAIVKGDLEDQLDSVEQADIVDDFGVSGSGAVFVYDTADVEAALPSLSAELSALDDASSASASFAGASSASSVFVSASLLVAAALISLFLF